VSLSLSLRTKLTAVVIATTVFVAIALMLAALLDYPIGQTALGATAAGGLVSLIETFYVGGPRGRWLRAMHPLASLAVYGLIVLAVGLVVLHLNHAVLGRLDRLPESYARLPVTLPVIFGCAIVAITAMRIVGFVGARNVLHLITGKYHRPVMEKRVFLFLDIKGSTALVERLGPVGARALIGKFFFDISAPITDCGGDIYRFTGDGLVATWQWDDAVADGAVLRAVDGIQGAVAGEAEHYAERFGVVPGFRIGIHGGEIVISEEGDTKRAIGFYGDTIHIAARMEQKAKELQVDTVVSEEVVNALGAPDPRLTEVARETVRGISRPIGMYTLVEGVSQVD
jgi:class 3 adenylate cyclase